MADKSKPTKARPRYVFFFTGPTACGKSTVAKYVADRLNFSFLEGDDVRDPPLSTETNLSHYFQLIYHHVKFHPQANVEKMHRGEPLTDADRRGWLLALRDHETAHPSGENTRHLVITCSALKRQYRDILREGSEQSSNLRVRFVFLIAPEEVLKTRARERKGHFAGEILVHSQFESLEMPGSDEVDVVSVDVNKDLGEVEQEALVRVTELLREDGA